MGAMKRDRLPAPILPRLYFGFAYACLAAAGLFAVAAPAALGGFHYHPRLAAVVHLVTLGWITSSVLGALWMVLPMALRSPLPQRRSDFVVFSVYAFGVVGMVAHFWLAEPVGLAWAAATVLPALAWYAARALPAILRARVPAAVRGHLFLALANLLAAALAGILLGIHKVWPMAWLSGLAVSSLSGAMGHAHLAAVGFVVMVVAGVGYRLLPMFLPAAMPAGRRLWASAALLQVGAWGLLVSLAGGPRLAGWPTLAAAGVSAAGVLAFFAEVVRMRRNPRPTPPALDRPDWGMVQVASALAWGALAVGLGLFLAGSGSLWESPAWEGRAAIIYGVAGLLGFLGQMVAGVGHRLLPLYFWLSRVPAAGLPDSPFNPLRLPSRRGQAVALAGWSLAVPLLALGLATHGRAATAAGGLALLTAAVAGAVVLGRASREARRRVEAALRDLDAAEPEAWDDRAMSEPVLATLERSPFFAALPAAAHRALADAASPSEIRKQIQLFAQGDPADALVLVVAGKVRLAQTGEDGSVVVVRFISPGEVFGCVAVVDDAHYPVSGDVVEAGEILMWPRHELQTIVAAHPQVAMAATATIAGRMRELQERFREVSTQRVDQRVAKALGRLAAQTGRDSGEAVVLDLPLSRLDLAEMTGTTLFTVSRLLSGWQRDGILEVGRQRVAILDPDALGRLAS